MNKMIKLTTKKRIPSFTKKGVIEPNIGKMNILNFFEYCNVTKLTSRKKRKTIKQKKIKTR